MELIPSSGHSPEIRLSVCNKGIDGVFSANCRIVDVRNDPNTIKTGVYSLKWLNHSDAEVRIQKNRTENLLIADLETDHGRGGIGLGEMRLLELNDGSSHIFDHYRWNFGRDERLPEIDLEITVFVEDIPDPHVTRFTLRPRRYSGPLELIEKQALPSSPPAKIADGPRIGDLSRLYTEGLSLNNSFQLSRAWSDMWNNWNSQLFDCYRQISPQLADTMEVDINAIIVERFGGRDISHQSQLDREVLSKRLADLQDYLKSKI